MTLRRTLVTRDTKCFHPTFHQSTITELPVGGSSLLNTVFWKTGVRAKEEKLVDILPMRMCVCVLGGYHCGRRLLNYSTVSKWPILIWIVIFTSVGRFVLLINFKKSLNSLKCHACSVFRGIVYSELNVTTSRDFSFFLQLSEKT